jgi:hypothetical protein
MNIPSYAALAAKLLGRHVPPAVGVGADRERSLRTIERAMLARARRRLVFRGAALLASAAALVLAWQVVRHARSGAEASAQVAIDVSPAGRGAALMAGGNAQPLAEKAELTPGQRIETPLDGGASLRLSTGTSMDLAQNTSFRVESQGSTEKFSLQRGELAAHVSKLKTGERFIIATPDAEIEVRGTRFRARVLEQAEACGDGSRTRLDVTEGLVEVRARGASVFVPAGEHWPKDCSSDAVPAAVAERAAAPAPASAEDGKHRFAPSAESTRAAEKASLLAQQNDAFAEAVALRRQGDSAAALRAYQDFMTRYPSSPLAENAMVERLRLLAGKKSSRARDEAQRYLQRYPHGFAFKEAEQLTAAP